jgi:aminoglycoside phosphotransferase (APT) family kinase protein
VTTADQCEVQAFLAVQGFSQSDASRRKLAGGGRHEVYLVEEGERKAVLKLHAPPRGTGTLDSFEHELRCHRFLAAHLPEHVPALLGSDSSSRALLFEWVEGTRPCAEQIDLDLVGKMASFLIAANRPELRVRAAEADIPFASEHGFSSWHHLRNAQQRITALLATSGEDPNAREMRDFVRDELSSSLQVWQSRCHTQRLDDPTSQVFSPSDFGFHNVLLRGDGRCSFLDFEHAGWDDPAKLVADFILQPDFVLAPALTASFAEELARSGCFGNSLLGAVHSLLPVQAVKWTCIVLNPFLALSPEAAALGFQLEKAKVYWQKVRSL